MRTIPRRPDRPDWRCLARPIAQHLTGGSKADHHRHIIARAAFAGALWACAAVKARFAEWGQSTGLHAAAEDLLRARGLVVSSLEPGERESLRRWVLEKSPVRDGWSLLPFLNHGAGVVVGPSWRLAPETNAAFMLAQPDFALNSFPGKPRRRLRVANAEVKQTEARFVNLAQRRRDELPRLAQRTADAWGFTWRWVSSDLAEGFIVDLYRRAYGISIDRQLHIGRERPPFVYDTGRAEPGETWDAFAERGHREFDAWIETRRPSSAPPESNPILEFTARALVKEHLGVSSSQLGREWHEYKRHAKTFARCACGSRARKYRKKVGQLLALAQ